MSVRMSFREVESVVVISAIGRILFNDGAAQLREAIKSCLNKGYKNILLDLAEVRSEGVGVCMDSSCIGELVFGYNETERRGGQLKLLNLPARAISLLRITNLLTTFQVYTDLDTAIRSFA